MIDFKYYLMVAELGRGDRLTDRQVTVMVKVQRC